jgi:hypothetical protein
MAATTSSAAYTGASEVMSLFGSSSPVVQSIASQVANGTYTASFAAGDLANMLNTR